jgi:cytochrome bd-type quinol oxidase subunit 2
MQIGTMPIPNISMIDVRSRLSSPSMRVTLLVLVVILAPLAIWGSIWMNRVAFGKSLENLRRNIKALEEM